MSELSKRQEKIVLFEQELYGETSPPSLRRLFLAGYISAGKGRMEGTSIFKSRAKDSTEISAFFEGLKQSVQDGVSGGSGLVDPFNLITEEEIRYSGSRDQAWKTFIEGVIEGYQELFDGPQTEKTMDYFAQTAGEHLRRIEVFFSPKPTYIEWPLPKPEHYEKALAFARTLESPKKENLLCSLMACLPADPSEPYSTIFTADDAQLLIKALIQETEGIQFEPLYILAKLNQYYRHEPYLVADILQAASSVAGGCLEKADHIRYVPHSDVGQFRIREFREALKNVEQSFAFAACEVGNTDSLGRVFVVHNKMTGWRVVHMPTDDIKSGFPLDLIESEEELPDNYLPLPMSVDLSALSHNERTVVSGLMEEHHSMQIEGRKKLLSDLRCLRPEINKAVARMKIELG